MHKCHMSRDSRHSFQICIIYAYSIQFRLVATFRTYYNYVHININYNWLVKAHSHTHFHSVTVKFILWSKLKSVHLILKQCHLACSKHELMYFAFNLQKCNIKCQILANILWDVDIVIQLSLRVSVFRCHPFAVSID